MLLTDWGTTDQSCFISRICHLSFNLRAPQYPQSCWKHNPTVHTHEQLPQQSLPELQTSVTHLVKYRTTLTHYLCIYKCFLPLPKWSSCSYAHTHAVTCSGCPHHAHLGRQALGAAGGRAALRRRHRLPLGDIVGLVLLVLRVTAQIWLLQTLKRQFDYFISAPTCNTNRVEQFPGSWKEHRQGPNNSCAEVINSMYDNGNITYLNKAQNHFFVSV